MQIICGRWHISKYLDYSVNDCIITWLSWKHCGWRRKCLQTISPINTTFVLTFNGHLLKWVTMPLCGKWLNQPWQRGPCSQLTPMAWDDHWPLNSPLKDRADLWRPRMMSDRTFRVLKHAVREKKIRRANKLIWKLGLVIVNGEILNITSYKI